MGVQVPHRLPSFRGAVGDTGTLRQILNLDYAGSNPVSPAIRLLRVLVNLRLSFKQDLAGSIPVNRTISGV